MIDALVLPLDERLVAHRAQIATLENAGIKPPAAWTKTNKQLDDYLHLRSPAIDNLIGSVIKPDASDDRVLLRALALAEANASHHTIATVNGAVVQAVLAKLRDTIAPVAADIYSKAAAMFDATAQAFTAAASVIDPETSAVLMVNKPEVERTAWTQCESLAGRLTSLTAPLTAAASLAGIPIDPDAPHDTLVLPLVCDPSDRHRRKVWLAFVTTSGRTGRWGALLKAGVTLKAADLDNFTAYRECRPLERRQEQLGGGRIRSYEYDPEDHPGAVEPIDPRRGSGRAVFAE